MARDSHDTDVDTPSRILDTAERLVQRRGFNGFSYADVAAELDVTKASLHYHFAGKGELGEALIRRYAARFAESLTVIDKRRAHARSKLDAYTNLYTEVLRDGGMCLCGMLAAEYQTLPKPMQGAVVRFFDENETWLQHVLDQGQADRTLNFAGSSIDAARMLIAALEGAMLVARPFGDITRFQASARRLVASLATPAGQDTTGTKSSRATRQRAAST